MSGIRIVVTAEDIAAAGDNRHAWADPVIEAIARVAGVTVDVDGGDEDGTCIATIGTTESSATLVVDLPPEASAWLDRRWGDADDRAACEPFEFEIEIPAWLAGLVGAVEWVTLAEASRELRTITANGLRTAARNRRDGMASERALAARLGMRRVGRDWLIPRGALEAEVARRRRAAEAQL